MKRLTKYLASGAADYNYPADCYGGNDCNDRAAKSAYRQTCVERLADYEDTGLTPGEVRSLWGEWNAMMRVLNSIGSYDRLHELVEAGADGRAITLPCKLGGEVWTPGCGRTVKLRVVEAALLLQGEDGEGYEKLSDFGKTFFATKEGAEEAKRNEWFT